MASPLIDPRQPKADLADGRRAGPSAAPIQAYIRCGYSALSHSVVDYWMPRLSGPEFKLIVFFLRLTIGDREKRFRGDLSVQRRLIEIGTQTGLDRETVIAAVRGLEQRALLTATRAHRHTTSYALNLPALLDPWVGNTDPESKVSVGNADSNLELVSGMPTQGTAFESGNPTQNPGLGSGFPTPIKINKAAAARTPQSRRNGAAELSQLDLNELRRISEASGIRLDGNDAMLLKAGVDRASLTLSHLRWFLSGEKFLSARSPRAVLLTIAKEFRERVRGMTWPNSLDPVQEIRGLTKEELKNS